VACGDASFPAAKVLKFGSGGDTKTIAADTAWTKDNVYVVIGKLAVDGGTLTIGAGTTVCFDTDGTNAGGIELGTGGLAVAGTAAEHVTLTSKAGMNAFWGALKGGSAYSSLSLAYADLYNAASGFPDQASGEEGAIITAASDTTPAITVDHVTMHRLNAGSGLNLSNTSGVAAGASLAITSYSDPASAPAQYAAVRIDPVAAGTLSAGMLTVGATAVPADKQLVELNKNELTTSVTYVDPGLPYTTADDFTVRSAGAAATLTLSPGVSLRLKQGKIFYVGDAQSNQGNVVIGQAGGKQTLITSRGDTSAQNGYFGTLWFQNFDPAVSKIENTRFEFGGQASSGLKNCHLSNSVTDHGMVVIQGTGAYPGPSITGSTFSHSAGTKGDASATDAIVGLCLQVADGGDCITTDYTAAASMNVFDQITGASQQPLGACP
jgi:hypothetical protein